MLGIELILWFVVWGIVMFFLFKLYDALGDEEFKKEAGIKTEYRQKKSKK